MRHNDFLSFDEWHERTRHKDFLFYGEWRDVHVIRISYLLANNLNVCVIKISYPLANNLNVCVIRISYPLVNDANVCVIRIFVFYDTISYPMTRRRIFFSWKKGKKIYFQIYPKVFLCTYVAIITYNYFKYLYNYFLRVVIFFESNVRPLREYIYIYTYPWKYR